MPNSKKNSKKPQEDINSVLKDIRAFDRQQEQQKPKLPCELEITTNLIAVCRKEVCVDTVIEWSMSEIADYQLKSVRFQDAYIERIKKCLCKNKQYLEPQDFTHMWHLLKQLFPAASTLGSFPSK